MARVRFLFIAGLLAVGSIGERAVGFAPLAAASAAVALAGGGQRWPILAAAAVTTAAATATTVEVAAVPRAPHMRTFATVVEALGGAAPARSATVRLEDGTRAEVPLRGPAPAVGERLRIRAALVPFDGPRNPGDASLREIMAERGIGGRLVHGRVLGRTPPDDRDWTLWLPRARAWASGRIHRRIAEPAATILAGALLGERGALPADLRAEFQDTGTMHVLVTAGLHLGVIALLARIAAALFGMPRLWSCAATVAVVWIYAAFTGGHLPSLRAATMATVLLAARACGRKATSWNALGIAACAIELAWPASVESLSFALSFSCVGGIALLARPIAEALERTRLPHVAREAATLALATQLATWPLTAAAFLEFAPYATLVNFVVVPLVGVLMIAGVALLALAPIPIAGDLCARTAEALGSAIAAAVSFGASLPFARVASLPPSALSIAAYDIGLVVARICAARKMTRTALGAFAAGTIAVVAPFAVPERDLVVRMLDVGQGEAIAIRTPGGHALLVDAGGAPEGSDTGRGARNAPAIGARIVVPGLVRLGIRHVDAIVMSHPHADHVGGVAAVIRTLGAGELVDDAAAGARGTAYASALAAARENGVPIVRTQPGEIWRFDDGVTLRFLGPSEPYFASGARAIDENSIAFMLHYGRFRMLFTGDAGEAEEARLLESGADLRADVLKAGHHGSRFASTAAFLAAVRPRVALASDGRENRYGLPAPEALARLRDAGARTFRTDEDGAITIRTDGTAVDVAPFLDPDTAIRFRLQTSQGGGSPRS